MGCNRPGHTREDCHHKNHPDFNRSGQWDGCIADRDLRARGKTGEEIKLTRGFRSDGTAIPRVSPGVSAAPSPYRRIVDDDTDATMIDAIVREAVVVVEVERVVDMPTSLEAQVRPVSPVSSPLSLQLRRS